MGICCGTNEKEKISNEIEADINSQFIVIYSKVGCPKCLRVKSQFHSIRSDPKIIEVTSLPMKFILKEMTHQKSLPYVFIKGAFVDNRKLESEISKGNLKSFIQMHNKPETIGTSTSGSHSS
ncbi:hypothetical protein SteCoe_30349 [Stentor coeruleus]|uniref:Glutaredoxin domain-containing protein n=1 Tax=Stentor coeruleus TaxID=5963 RepID=A0A1R2B3S5_9CILI|nr:hypothetical protein SteCoe_30349 [Stentor coeruleus]